MIKEHDRVVLTSDVPEEDLRAGDVGTVVHVHGKGKAFEVEFLTLDGDTFAVITVPAPRLRPVSHQDITHARPLKLAV